jgi:hypothetical protein
MSAIGTHTITVGDTLLPLNTVLRDGNGNPFDLSLYTVRFQMETDTGTSELATTTTGVTAHPTQTFTAEADDDYLTCNGHGVKEGDQIIVANSGGALPTGLAAATRYFARDVHANVFRVATISAANQYVNITTDGTGTNTFYVVGSVQFDFASTNVDTAGNYRGWFTLDSGSELETLPKGDKWFSVVVVNKGN